MTNKIQEISSEVNEISFDSITREYLLEIEKAKLQAIADVVRPFETQKDTIAIHYMRLNSIAGEWRRKDDNSGLIRTDKPAQVIPILPESGPIVHKPRKRK